MIGFDLGKVGCSATVKAALDEAGVRPAELLRHHQFNLDEDAAEMTQPTADGANWACSSFELPKFGRTVWVVTDPQQISTSLYLEEP